MESNSQPKRRSVTAPCAAPCLPVEVTEMCLWFSAQFERDRLHRTPRTHLGLLRLISRHFRDLFTKELFKSVLLDLFQVPIQRCPIAFLKILRKNNNILKHVRRLTVRFHNSQHDISPAEVAQACKVVQVFCQAPLRTLVITGLDKDFPCRPIFNALHALRSVPSLQTLSISGSAIPPFLVCGHFAATRLKTILVPNYSSPDNSTSENLQPHLQGLSIGPDSALVSAFQPFANLEELDIPNGVDVPKYFRLHDFGSAYYPSNGRIPFTLPALRKLCIGNSGPEDDEADSDVVLNAEDYNALGTLLSRAPRLETLAILDQFCGHHGLDDFTPLIDQLPSLKNLRCLELADVDNEQDAAINLISDILGMFPPIPTLETLIIHFQWSMVNIEATRATLYFSQAWKKLQRVLARPTLESLQVLRLHITIEILHDDRREETFGPEEADALKNTLVDLYSRDGKLEVTIKIKVDDL